MRIPRFFVAPSSIDASSRQVYISDPAQLKQILSVLRLKRGSALDILDGSGAVFHCSLASATRNDVCATIESSEPAAADPAAIISVALPLLKSGRFEWAIEKMTELGVSRIIPVICARSVVRPSDSSRVRREPDDKLSKLRRWRSIAREAAEQCERGTIPEVVPPVELQELLKAPGLKAPSPSDCLALICAERRNADLLQEVLGQLQRDLSTRSRQMQRDDAKCGAHSQNLLIVVGPEGGFTEEELKFASDIGLRFVNLGKRILRSETAAIYALSIATSFFDN